MKTRKKPIKKEPTKIEPSLTELKAMAFDRARLAEQFRAEAAALSQEIAKREAATRQNNVRQLEVQKVMKEAAKVAENSSKKISKKSKRAASK